MSKKKLGYFSFSVLGVFFHTLSTKARPEMVSNCRPICSELHAPGPLEARGGGGC